MKPITDFNSLLANWAEQEREANDAALRFANEPVGRELTRDAAQYRDSAHQVNRVLDLHWQMLAQIFSMPMVADAIIEQAKQTKYFDLEGYMERDWLFNPFETVNGQPVHNDRTKPSIRIHHILRADLARHPHSHPWTARTIILKGWYEEKRMRFWDEDSGEFAYDKYTRKTGDTAVIKADDYHHISDISEGGAWTMFVMGPYEKSWGFCVDGEHVPWREYEKRFPTPNEKATVEPESTN